MAVRSSGSPSSAAIVGLNTKTAARAVTTAVLANSPTYAGGVLTAGSNGAFPAQDGITLAASERVLVKNQASALQNGIYSVTTVGTASVPYVLTRVSDMDTWSDIPSAMCTVQEGSTLSDSVWVCTADEGGTLGTTSIAFSRIGGSSLWT